MKKSAIFLTITLLFMMAFTSGCQKDATNEKNRKLQEQVSQSLRTIPEQAVIK
ncbi:hypothetical protein [Latilactobacillus curvatus]|uniref:hypothetical protein n=1 Tax=Latilactobacillus curvatus TaxID=28038 RepID=UPI0012FD994B|nr:hypothetical protein [Latilactobacillus curvatus]